MNNNTKITGFGSCVTLGFGLFSLSAMVCAQAQTAPRNKVQSKMMEEVVVVAQRREQSINEVPVAVSALSGDQLKTLGVVDPRDLNTVIPGFTASDGGYGNPVYTLRGVGFNDSSYFATPATAVYIDEVNLPYSIMSKGPSFDIAQLEVLKGPQGTLFGRSSTGGAINFIPNKPGDQLEAGVTLTHGNYQTTDVEGFISVPISDSFGYRIAGRGILREEGWQYSNTDHSRTNGEQEKYALRGIFDWDTTDDLNFQLMLSGWRDTSDAQAGQPTLLRPQNPFADNSTIPLSEYLLVTQEVQSYPYIPNTTNPRVAEWCEGDQTCTDVNGNPLNFEVNDTFFQGALKSKWLISDRLEANFLASYTNFESDDSQFPTGALNTKHAELQVTIDMTVIDLEARLSGYNESETIRWLVGIHSTPKDNADQVLMINFGGNTSVLFPLSDLGFTALGFGAPFYPSPGETNYKSIAPYANVEWQFTDDFKLSVGMRYTDEERDFTGCTGALAGDPIHLLFQGLSVQRSLLSGRLPDTSNLLTGGCITISPEGEIGPHQETIAEDSLSYRVVLDWQPNDDYLFYLSQTRGFKSGSFPVLNASDTTQLQGVTQEQVDATEIGAKMDFMEGLLHVNAAAFYYDYKDKQLFSRFQDAIFGSLPALDNAPKSKVQGVELDFTSSPIAGLYLSGAIAYIETEATDFKDGFDTAGNPTDLSGREFNFSPPLTYSLLADYSFLLFDSYEGGVAVDYAYKDETNSSLDGDPGFAHDDFGIFNARVRVGNSDGSWTLSLWGKNLTDEYYVNSVFPAVGDVKFRYAGMPKTYGVTFDYKYF